MNGYLKDIGRVAIGSAVCIGFLTLTAYVITNRLPGGDILIGALAAAFGGVVHWAFGGSRGSEVKTDLLARAEPVDPKE